MSHNEYSSYTHETIESLLPKEEELDRNDSQETAPYPFPGDSKDEEIAKLKAQLDETKDRWMRQAAEMDNYKKRSEREKNDFLKRANEGMILSFLPIIDNLSRALANPGDISEQTPFYQGVQMIYADMQKMLEKQGVTKIDSLGQVFDPIIHEAIMQQTDNSVPENTVLNEMQAGYMYKEKLLRPAMVIVSKKE